MTSDQRDELRRDRLKAAAQQPFAIIGELSAIARLLRSQGRMEAAETIHRAIDLIEAPGQDGAFSG
jgi:hypothetical protein